VGVSQRNEKTVIFVLCSMSLRYEPSSTLGQFDLESDDDLMLVFAEVINLGPALVETQRIGLSKDLGPSRKMI
jgi:hypothetical protein